MITSGSFSNERVTPRSGVPGLTMCWIDHPVARRHEHIVKPGSLGERDVVCSPGSEAGRRRSISVVAAVSVTFARTR
jgi:hypothetical protein